jgi:hypothetical protein
MPVEMIPFEGQLDLAIVRRALWLVGKPGPVLRWTFTLLAGPFVLLMVVLLFHDPDPSLFVGPAVLGGLIAWVWLAPLSAARSTLRANQALYGTLRGAATPAGVELRNEHTISKFPFSLYDRFKASQSLVVLVHANGVLDLFPREFFHSDDDFARFRGLVVSQVRPSRDLRRFLVPLAIWLAILLALIAIGIWRS